MTEGAGENAITTTVNSFNPVILGPPCPAVIYLSESVAVGCKHPTGHSLALQPHEVTLAWTDDVAHLARVI